MIRYLEALPRGNSFLLSSFVFLFFTSCSKNDFEEQIIQPVKPQDPGLLLKSVKTTTDNIYIFEYDGKKLKKKTFKDIHGLNGNYEVFEYNGNLISKISVFNLADNSKLNQIFFTYDSQNNLISLKDTKTNTVRNFRDKSKSSITYSEGDKYGYVYFENNLIVGEERKYSSSPVFNFDCFFNYDTNKSVSKNVLGIDNIQYSGYSVFGSVFGFQFDNANNLVNIKYKPTESSIVTGNSYTIKYIYTYNEFGYPLTCKKMKIPTSGTVVTTYYTYEYHQ